MQRANGAVCIGFGLRDGRTRLTRLYQEGSAKARFPKAPGGCMEAVLINTAGGLTGGDRFRTEIDAAEGTTAVITTQASEKIYRASGGHARVETRIRVGPGGRVDWLPQEAILFDKSRLARRLEVDLAEDATLLMLEGVIFGRRAMGERITTLSFSESCRVHRADRLVHADELALDGAVDRLLATAATFGGGGAMATLLYLAADAEDHLDAARDAIRDAGGASAWDGKLTARLVAADGLALRRRLVPLIASLTASRTLPKVWHI